MACSAIGDWNLLVIQCFAVGFHLCLEERSFGPDTLRQYIHDYRSCEELKPARHVCQFSAENDVAKKCSSKTDESSRRGGVYHFPALAEPCTEDAVAAIQHSFEELGYLIGLVAEARIDLEKPLKAFSNRFLITSHIRLGNATILRRPDDANTRV